MLKDCDSVTTTATTIIIIAEKPIINFVIIISIKITISVIESIFEKMVEATTCQYCINFEPKITRDENISFIITVIITLIKQMDMALANLLIYSWMRFPLKVNNSEN